MSLPVSTTDRHASGERRRSRLRFRSVDQQPVGYLFTLPYVIFFLSMIAYPLGFAIYLSFHEWSIVSDEKPFVGLDNFRRLPPDEQRAVYALCEKLSG